MEKYKTIINNWNYGACCILISLPVSDFNYERVCNLHVHIYKHGNGEKLWPVEIMHESESLSNIIINV